MALMTMIARVIDGLPLVGTMTEDEQVGKIQNFPKSVSTQFSKNNNRTIYNFSRERVYWSIRIKRKCYSESWAPNRRQDVQLKQDHTYSSKCA